MKGADDGCRYSGLKAAGIAITETGRMLRGELMEER